jgi:pantoate--beta-alanine ligase
MKVIENVAQWRDVRESLTGSIGFVATMGALHGGHASLLARSARENDITVLSIFLNATQFNNPADLTCYPKTLERDLTLACRLGADYVITPSNEEIYADQFRYQIQETQFSRELCGAHRDGHFTGVLTVVMKLLNIVQPRRAYFGEKDFQQYQLIKDMCEAFFMDVDIVPCETVREDDGLALSSRNELLDAPARETAGVLNELIRTDLDDAAVAAALTEAGFCVDYIVTKQRRRFAAAALSCEQGNVRLIDNVTLATLADA